MYNYISNYKGRTDLVDLYGDNANSGSSDHAFR